MVVENNLVVRALLPEDIDQLKKIYAHHYSNEFEFPNFLDKFLCVFVVHDDNDRIISGGGVRLIAESTILTDKDYPIKIRRAALYKTLDALCFLASDAGFDRLHAVSKNKKWLSHLKKKVGFHSRGEILVLDL